MPEIESNKPSERPFIVTLVRTWSGSVVHLPVTANNPAQAGRKALAEMPQPGELGGGWVGVQVAVGSLDTE